MAKTPFLLVNRAGKGASEGVSKNRAVTTGKTAVVTIMRKGSCKGSATRNFAVTIQKLSELEENHL